MDSDSCTPPPLVDSLDGEGRRARATGGCSLVGRRLSRYEVRELIGCGGMGVVYRAFDPAHRREVALKVLPAERGADVRWRLRFREEARTGASLEGPHVCTTHEVDEADGFLFMAMELIQGERLLDQLRRWNSAQKRYVPVALPLRRALELGIEVARALDRVHAEGIVHLDLKPSNVMVTASGHAKLIDFGLSRLLDLAPSPDCQDESSSARQWGRVCGTLCYMSPEQAAGLPVDQRSDVFSFGVLLHEMLTGTNPLRARGRPVRLAGSPPGPLPAAPVAEGASVVSALQYVLDRCLARAPQDRYATMRDVIADLGEVSAWLARRGSPSVSLPGPRETEDEVSGGSGGPDVGGVPSGPTRPQALCPPLHLDLRFTSASAPGWPVPDAGRAPAPG